MKTNLYATQKFWGRLLLPLAIAALIAACGGGDEPAPEPAATTPPPAATEAAPAQGTPEEPSDDTQPESPLSQPDSPLTTQPESPLTTVGTPPRTEEEAIALAATTTAVEPDEGLGSLAGVVYSFGTVPGAVRGTQVYLEPATEIEGKFYPPVVSVGPSVEDGDIIVETNNLGQLQMQVAPGNYYMAVWTLYDWRLVVADPAEEAPRLITIEEGDQLDLGVLYAYWP